jgi:hypothetical protein
MSRLIMAKRKKKPERANNTGYEESRDKKSRETRGRRIRRKTTDLVRTRATKDSKEEKGQNLRIRRR